MQLSALAVAVLVIVAAAAVALTAGPAQARVDYGTDGRPETEINVAQHNTPTGCDEESKPGPNTVDEIRAGYYAVFDGYWVADEGHLSNNFCPPEVTVTEHVDPVTHKTVKVYTRHDANIDIRKTAFSIPDSYKVTVVDSSVAGGNPSTVTGPKIDLAQFPFMKDFNAVSAMKTEGGSTVFADNKVWWVKLKSPGTSPLQVGYSTALMNEADWYNPDGDPVQFEFEAVHVFQDGTRYSPRELHQLGIHFFAFDPGASQRNAQWSSVDTDTNSVEMQTGEYRQMQFAFTKPGSYEVQVHVKGHVRNDDDPPPPGGRPAGWEPVSGDDTITSPVQWYTFHVGSQADLDVAVSAGAMSTSEGVSTVPITVTATNGGPDNAENVEVEINLPPGLSPPATLPTGVSSNSCGVIAWEIEDLHSSPPSQTTTTLPFNATVDSGATGKRTVTAEIHSSTYDADTTNNSTSADAELSGTNVRPPYFPGVSRSIVEHAIAGAHAGDPVAAVNPDGNALSYFLSGPCSTKFQALSNGQIVLAPNQTLDYGEQWEYPLTLNVSDNLNPSGATDPSIDDSTPVLIRVEDTEPGAVHPTVNLSISPNPPIFGSPAVVTAAVSGLEAGVSLSACTWDLGNGDSYVAGTIQGSSCTLQPDAIYSLGNQTYGVHLKWPGGGISGDIYVQWQFRPPNSESP